MTFNVVVDVINWSLGGVTSWAANLVSGLLQEGIGARVLATQGILTDKTLPFAGFPLELAPWKDEPLWSVRWNAMIEYLERLAPCVYLPNIDVHYSCISPKLSTRVVIVGNIHSDNAEYYEHFAQFGRYWNQTVAGSEYLRAQYAARQPELAHRLCVLPYGVAIPETRPRRHRTPGAPLRILYSGRLNRQDKRVFDLPRIMEALMRRKIPAQLSLTGWGRDEEALRATCRDLMDRGVVHFYGVVSREYLDAIYEAHDVIILLSEYEGKPLALIEGMGRGCVPVVTDVPSGVPELVTDGVNGYMVPVGAIETFADRLAALQQDPGLRDRLSQAAFQTVSQGGYRIEDMVAGYAELFRRLIREAAAGQFRRPRGSMPLPCG